MVGKPVAKVTLMSETLGKPLEDVEEVPVVLRTVQKR